MTLLGTIARKNKGALLFGHHFGTVDILCQIDHCFSSSAQTPPKLLLKACATPPHMQ